MPLSRQILLIVSLMFALIFVGTFVLTVQNTRQFLVTQMQSHAQDTATSLGLSLSPHMASEDVLLMESMVDAIFDRGYYREILVRSIKGEALIKRELPIKVYQTPAWFVSLLPLSFPTGEADVMAGWRQGGTVLVRSHPGHAYAKLWDTAKDTLAWALVSLVLAIIITMAALRVILLPLRDVERQAIALSDLEFPLLSKVPRTRELRRVILAMNDMTQRVQGMLTLQYQRVRELRDQAYADSVTGLGNRAAFDRDLSELVTRREEYAFGACLLIAIDGLDEANAAHGYEGGDELIKTGAARVDELLEGATSDVARLGGVMFGIGLKNVTEDEVFAIADNLVRELAQVAVRDLAPGGVNVGVAIYDGTQCAEFLKSDAEQALRVARESPSSEWRTLGAREAVSADAADAVAWENTLREVIATRAMELYFQPVVQSTQDIVLHYEVLARVRKPDGETVPAGAFLGVAKRAGLAVELDRLIVELAMEQLSKEADQAVRYAINLSPGPIQDSAFTDWLRQQLDGAPTMAGRLAFEVSSYAASIAPDAVLNLAADLRERRFDFGIDHFGSGDMGFDFIRRLKLQYTKIDGGFITGIETDEEQRAFVKGCVDAGRGADILTIAEFVESQAELDTLRDLGVFGVQGYLVGRPEPRGE